MVFFEVSFEVFFEDFFYFLAGGMMGEATVSVSVGVGRDGDWEGHCDEVLGWSRSDMVSILDEDCLRLVLGVLTGRVGGNRTLE